ncbi:MAG TPA: hypothetical protein VLE53_11445 [Gemmatimonadaceae bacterium]|nr:hypothetical protein [Gemmatimonadaceae bacterium]
MSDVVLFTVIFGGLFILRIVAATVLFALLLPRGDRCPNCDAPTMRISARLMDRCLPWFRRSWCLRCGWQGMLRRGPVTEQAERASELTRR